MNESEETMEALNRGFDDAVHGRVHPLDEVLREVNPGVLHRMMDQMNRFAEAVKNMAEEVGKTALSMKESQQSFNPKSGVDSQRSPTTSQRSGEHSNDQGNPNTRNRRGR